MYIAYKIQGLEDDKHNLDVYFLRKNWWYRFYSVFVAPRLADLPFCESSGASSSCFDYLRRVLASGPRDGVLLVHVPPILSVHHLSFLLLWFCVVPNAVHTTVSTKRLELGALRRPDSREWAPEAPDVSAAKGGVRLRSRSRRFQHDVEAFPFFLEYLRHGGKCAVLSNDAAALSNDAVSAFTYAYLCW